MLVVADEGALRVGGEGGLARPGEAEEDGHIPARADVDGRVHGQHAFVRQSIVEDAECTLLHLSRVLRATDEDLLAAKVDKDDRLASDPVSLGVGAEARSIDDGEVGHEPCKVRGGRHPEQVAAEDAGPGGLGVGTHRPPPARVGAHIAITHIQLTIGQVIDHAPPQGVVSLLGDGTVEASPGDPLVRVIDIHEVLVLGRPAGVLAGPHQQRTTMRHQPFRRPDGAFVQLGHGQVHVPHATEIEQWRGRNGSRHGHRRPPAGATCHRT